ncbi:MAG TPA: tRNA preQ1(34) S-adenosylmethionine ribosyltransferase-isomerase QueA [Dongiaceae bacterium]
MSLRLADFDFDLPGRLIARYPANPRDSAKLLTVGSSGIQPSVSDRHVRDLPGLLGAGDLLVFNDTKVIPAQLSGRRAGRAGGPSAKTEVTLHKREGADSWRAFAKPAKRLALGERIVFADGFFAEVTAKSAEGDLALRFNVSGNALRDALQRHGEMPLPPYIRKLRPATMQDSSDYQTVYARAEGAVAAPTAGLHFTPELLDVLAGRGIEQVHLTLHVGAGTFLPVKSERIEEHRMHAEHGEITAAAAAAINRARNAGRRIVAVGTTSLRLLESAADEDGHVRAFTDETSIFITPGYRFKAVDLLMTNFHLPKSTLFMLVAAFAGLDRMKAAYAHAIAANYRFFSYGDASLLERAA